MLVSLDSERLYQFRFILLVIHGLVLVVVRMFVHLASDHMYPVGGYSVNRKNFVKPFHESDKLLFESKFQ